MKDELFAFVGAVLVCSAFFFGGMGVWSGTHHTSGITRPCSTSERMAACIGDISDEHAAAIGVPTSKVLVSCVKSINWTCFTEFPLQGRTICIQSSIKEGPASGIPVFIGNTEPPRSVCDHFMGGAS